MELTQFPDLYQITSLGKRILSRKDIQDDMHSLLSYIDAYPFLTTNEIKDYCIKQNAFKVWKQTCEQGYISRRMGY